MTAARNRMNAAKARYTAAAQAAIACDPDAVAIAATALRELGAARDALYRSAGEAPGGWKLAAMARAEADYE